MILLCNIDLSFFFRFLQGSVEVRDGDSEYISIELTRTAETMSEVDLITHQVELHDTTRGKMLVIQVVSFKLNNFANLSCAVINVAMF
jgi:hypothetical protein